MKSRRRRKTIKNQTRQRVASHKKRLKARPEQPIPFPSVEDAKAYVEDSFAHENNNPLS